jgi:hypothetical protein
MSVCLCFKGSVDARIVGEYLDGLYICLALPSQLAPNTALELTYGLGKLGLRDFTSYAVSHKEGAGAICTLDGDVWIRDTSSDYRRSLPIRVDLLYKLAIYRQLVS